MLRSMKGTTTIQGIIIIIINTEDLRVQITLLITHHCYNQTITHLN